MAERGCPFCGPIEIIGDNCPNCGIKVKDVKQHPRKPSLALDSWGHNHGQHITDDEYVPDEYVPDYDDEYAGHA